MSRRAMKHLIPNPEHQSLRPTAYHEIFPGSGRSSKIRKAAAVFIAGWLFVSNTTGSLQSVNDTLSGDTFRAKPRPDAVISSERTEAIASVTKSLQGLSLNDKFAINYLGAKGPAIEVDLTTRGNRLFNRARDFQLETIDVQGSSCLKDTPFDTASKESRMPRTAVIFEDPLFQDVARLKTVNGLELSFIGADSGVLSPADDFTRSILANTYTVLLT
jgi:hypothetical protein